MQTRTCAKCEKELRDNLTVPHLSNLRFSGPVLIRSEAGYHVLSLPSKVKLIFGDLAEKDCVDFPAQLRQATPAERDGAVTWWEIKADLLSQRDRLSTVLQKAQSDPYDPVRHAANVCAKEVLQKVNAEKSSDEKSPP
jgi:hypothetical protein